MEQLKRGCKFTVQWFVTERMLEKMSQLRDDPDREEEFNDGLTATLEEFTEYMAEQILESLNTYEKSPDDLDWVEFSD